jgi:hypothetical protein
MPDFRQEKQHSEYDIFKSDRLIYFATSMTYTIFTISEYSLFIVNFRFLIQDSQLSYWVLLEIFVIIYLPEFIFDKSGEGFLITQGKNML